MSLEVVKSLGYGGQHLNDVLPRALLELQGLTISGPLTGTTANTNIPVVEGIDLQDTPLKALQFSAGVPSDITSTISITDVRPKGTMTVVTGLADGDTCQINGKTYTAKSVTPSFTSRGLGIQQFSTGKQADGATTLTVQQIMALNLVLLPTQGFGPDFPTIQGDTPDSMPLTYAQAITLQAAGPLAIAALSLANAINQNDSLVLTASVPASLTSAIVSIWADAESTAGNSIALGTTGGNSHYTASGATLSGGLNGTANGTLTLSTVVAGNTVTIAGTTFTAVAANVVATLNADAIGGPLYQFNAIQVADITVGSTCNAQTALMNSGLTMGQAQSILTAATQAVANNATAYLLMRAINSVLGTQTGSQATGGIAGLTGINNAGAGAGAGTGVGTVVATLPAASAVITLNAVQDTAAGNAITLTQVGGTITVSGATLTAPIRGIQSTSVTTGNTIVLFWWKKSRTVVQQ